MKRAIAFLFEIQKSVDGRTYNRCAEIYFLIPG